MMGLAGSITPATTGKIIIIINGTMQNDTQGDGCGVSIYTGTGSAPSNGAATTGTSRGASTVANQAQPGNTFFQFPFSIAAVVTGLSAGTTYWIDANMGAISGGTCTMLSPNITAAEL
jgi:hypothetical protein